MAKRRTPITDVESQHDTTTFDALANQVAQQIIASRGQRTDWTRWISVISLVLAIVGGIFSAGINFGRLSQLESRMTQVERAQENLDRQQRTDLKELAAKVDELRASVAEIKGQLQQQARATR